MSDKTDCLGLLLRGMAMGAADVVPGVSGGTIAFITGIYDRLLNSLRSFSPTLLLLLKNEGIKACWKKVDGTFLVCVFSGILISILSFAHLISYLLAEYPVLIWSFFFGLILVSGLHMVRQIEHYSIGGGVLFVLAAVGAYLIGTLTPASLTPTPVMLFFAGSIAICAMILPGISGSFLLLLMGLYATVLQAVKTFDLFVLAIFASGCVVGLLSFSHVLSWLLRKHRDLALSLLTGLMMGALGKVWPWKQTLETRINSSGEVVPFLEVNVSPLNYESLTGTPAFLMPGLLLMAAAIIMFLMIEWLGHRK
ncbi:membrane protein [Endozoicomonas montiporae]|uniref:Membrane protein n=2 Tax=Endozoicomonas montiporae TaxID=1027273 RepID=A0A081NBQ2_9GAMM|nr:DUF368 domain-containing protein [Endozoicomonas montiporae]AMO56172.1 membrane protein [Endozoicomonas montiporae CL-33]KEQ15875.1 membrane protein [Endozoicomonas montiporae]